MKTINTIQDFVLEDQHLYPVKIIYDIVSQDAISNKIRSFANLPEGWDFGVGTHPSPKMIRKALEIERWGSFFHLKTNAFPGTDGEISITFYCKDESVDVTINLDLSYTVTYEKGIGVAYDQVAYEENVKLATVLNFLNRLSCTRWRSSEDFLEPSTIPNSGDFEVTPSKTPREQSPSLIWSAFKIALPTVSVPI